MAESIALFEVPNGTRTCSASAALTGARFVNISGVPVGDLMAVGVPAAGAAIVGVTAHDAASGATVAVHQVPGMIIPVEIGTGGVTAGDVVQTDNAGKAILRVAGIACGRAMETKAAGAQAYVLLLPACL